MFNFYFAGHETSKQFNRWLVKDYLTTYPSPPRNKSDHVIPRDDPKLALVKEHKGVIKRIKNDGLGVLRYRRLRCQRQARN